MSSVRTRLLALARRFDALARRERVMVFAASVTAVLGLVFTLFIDPALARAKAARAAIAERHGQIAMQRVLLADLKTRAGQDVNAAVRADLEKITAQLSVLDGEIRALHQSLIPAQAMGTVLASLVRHEAGVKLVSLRNLPPEPITEEQVKTVRKDGAGIAPPAGKALLYRHGIELVIEGGYFDLLNYLSVIEKQSWRMLWSETVLSARYPVSRLHLKLHTLSMDETWLSV